MGKSTREKEEPLSRRTVFFEGNDAVAMDGQKDVICIFSLISIVSVLEVSSIMKVTFLDCFFEIS